MKQLRQHRLHKLMEQNPLTKGILTENFIGIGTVTREMVLKRAQELAMINGHSPKDVSEPESGRWDPVPGSTGNKAPESSDEDEDNEGRSEVERLVEEGVQEAEHDQMVQAAKAAAKKDNEGL